MSVPPDAIPSGWHGPCNLIESETEGRPRLSTGVRPIGAIGLEGWGSGQERQSGSKEEVDLMGTSTDYSAPPAWGQLKGGVTRAAGHALTPARAGELLSDHVATNGGARQIASGGGVLGAGRSSQSVARNIGGFISQVANVGLSETLRQNGLQELMGRPASEVLLGILALCSGTNGSIDAVDARSARHRG